MSVSSDLPRPLPHAKTCTDTQERRTARNVPDSSSLSHAE